MTKGNKHSAASVKARLLNYAKQEGVAFNRILIYYFQERFLYRVAQSPHQHTLILKGGALLLALNIGKGRPTQDIDFLARLEQLDHATAMQIIRDIASIPGDDGVVFYPDSIRCTNIREDGGVNALRVHCDATLGTAKGAMQIDIGFKDVAIPDPVSFSYPTILDFPAPLIDAYCWETVIAEKFEAMLSLYTLNSRLKDFYDISYLATRQSFDGTRLQNAIAGTLRKRGIVVEPTPSVFQPLFMQDATKQVQWQAFLRKTGLNAEPSFEKIMTAIREFLAPVVAAIADGRELAKRWDCERGAWDNEEFHG